MLALFRCWLPGPQGKALPPGLSFVLAGDTPDDLAWDLVELFHEAVGRRQEKEGPDRHTPYPKLDAAELDRALSHTLAFQAGRFSPAWWERQEWRLIDRLSEGYLGKMRLPDFPALFPPDVLLSLYLAEMVGGYFAPIYGDPPGPLDGATAIAYFQRHRCLTPITASDVAGWSGLSA